MDDAPSTTEREVVESGHGAPRPEKDPRRVARRYQLELCQKALEENIIVYLETGCGKTHIAVLLMYELRHLILRPQKNICVFLAPTVALVQQQARVIEDSLDLKVGTYCGSSKQLKTHQDWEKEIEQYEVLVMTPQILLRNLYHRMIKTELIALLIFDECHHAQITSNHPYAEIMRYCKSDVTKLPRIFGMTASPVVGTSSQANLSKSINSLEILLDAKVCSVEDKTELYCSVVSPVIYVHSYGPVVSGTSSLLMTFYSKLEQVKRQCIAELSKKTSDYQSIRSTKKTLNRVHDSIMFCLENLGLWGALQAKNILLSGDHIERNELIEEGNNGTEAERDYSADAVCAEYLAQASDIIRGDYMKDAVISGLSCIDILKEPFLSSKVLRLIGILSSFRLQQNMKCIIFVNRIVTARSLSYILQNLKNLASWKNDFLVGVHSKLKSMSRKTMQITLDKFRSGELNLLVATKVGEEGLDIQTCSLVIRFDLPETVASFIQSRGRARMPQSEYVFLVNSGSQKELDLIETFRKDENRMNMEVAFRTSSETFVSPEEQTYIVASSGASITSGYSISLLHQYCSKLPHDEYYVPSPEFYFLSDVEGTICHIILPSNAPMHQIVSAPRPSMEDAKRNACLKAIEELHKLGALSDYLLPLQDNADVEECLLDSSDSETTDGEDSRGELHEMRVPAVLKESWNKLESLVTLRSYYIKFDPEPNDRIYRSFGLFLKAPLPAEAETMELDLHLAHGRSVMTKLVPSGCAEFVNDEILLAQNFQEMFLKFILDRAEFVSEFVPLGKYDFSRSSSSTFYLLLPVFLGENDKISIDWGIIRKCLSSPVFSGPGGVIDSNIISMGIRLASGYRSISEVENSVVYVPYKKTFYFITNVCGERNAYSQYKENPDAITYVDHLSKKFEILLVYPEQPLLCAKPVFSLHNLLHTRRQEVSEVQQLDEYFIYLPPELCELKVIGFSKDIGSSVSLLPSIMHRLENLLVAIELKHVLCTSFPEGAEVTAQRVLEALTTEKCQERFSLERLELLGDAFLKFAVGRHFFLLYALLDEGELTRKRSNVVNNSNLLKLATRSNLQLYIRDQPFEPSQFFALGRPCKNICDHGANESIHSQDLCKAAKDLHTREVRCSKGHHWLHYKTIADVVEALVGAFIVDSGFKAAIAFLNWIGIKVDFEASEVTKVCIASSRYIPLAAYIDTAALESSLGYQFLHRGLLLQAFVHPSYNKNGGGCYQRLEFLGDAVLDYMITSYLYSVYPKLKPGHMTDLRSISVNNKTFATVAVARSFHKFLVSDSCTLSEAIKTYVNFIETSAPDSNLVNGPTCPKALGDLVESCLGAILLDTGFDLNLVWKIMLSFLKPVMSFSNVQFSPVRELRELCQAHSWDLKFLPSKKGKTFSVEATVKGNNVSATVSSTGLNKKDAIRSSAQLVFEKLKAQGNIPKSKLSLEEVLKSSCKMEAKLIGYDETPVDVTAPYTIEFENLNLQEPSSRSLKSEVDSISEVSSSYSSIKRVGRPPASRGAVKVDCTDSSNNHSTDANSKNRGAPHNLTARAHLYETCAANYWEPPVFECCKDDGPSHLKSYIFKVTMKMDDASDTLLEAVGAPRTSKKAAAEQAAEGALWFLIKNGYIEKSGQTEEP
ncbi:dicer-like protein 4 isoform X2 [Argentina anserina]|uniref:dicer-like protein 4 isoform X2 n=1 Tax=Argentina anserina TaxID=57926 RepID=UPI0021762F0A|nr:dicer-like protein 4 isoform X2 [Potentilla anserina]